MAIRIKVNLNKLDFRQTNINKYFFKEAKSKMFSLLTYCSYGLSGNDYRVATLSCCTGIMRQRAIPITYIRYGRMDVLALNVH